jgi:hypothetical protein
VFCLFDGFKKTFRARVQRVLSFWQVQKDISDPGAACFVFLAGSKRHFEPGYSVFCLFDGFKKTFRTRMQLVLSFWQVQKDISGSGAACLSFWPVQKDISGSDAACFVLLAGSKGHFEPRCGLFCLFGRFKRTFRARMQRVLSCWQV